MMKALECSWSVEAVGYADARCCCCCLCLLQSVSTSFFSHPSSGAAVLLPAKKKTGRKGSVLELADYLRLILWQLVVCVLL